MKNWVDITTIDNNTPFYDVAWSFSAHTDGEISFGDRWFAERPGLVTDNKGWQDGGPIEMGRYGFHRFNSSAVQPGEYISNFDDTNTNPHNIPNCGYTISVGDGWINNLPNVETISGTPCYCLGLREWVDWKPLYGAYSGMSTMFEPGNIFVQLASTGITNKKITNAYVGDTQVAKIYLGADVVYEATPVGPTAHTASVLLDGSVDVDLPETTADMYDMVFTEPYTSLTLYYDDEVVTASTLTISVDGSQSTTETDYEVANINTDTYGFSSISAISFNAATNDVYIDFAP